MNQIKRRHVNRRMLLFRLTTLFTFFLAFVVCWDSYGAEKPVGEFLKGWETETAHELGFRVTSITEPGDKDTASVMSEVVFELPDHMVDMAGLTDGFLNKLDIDIKETLPVEQQDGAYQRSYLASEKGEDVVYRLDVIGLQEATSQRVLLLAALPEMHDVLGGRDALLRAFTGGKSIDALARDAVERRTLLEETPDNHVMTTSSGGIPFTHADFKIGVEFAEFMAGRRLSGADIQRLLSIADEEWEEDPNPEAYDEIGSFLEQAREANPFRRLETATALYADLREQVRASGERSRFMDLVGKLNPVLAERNGAILTERALEARLRSAKTVMQLEGRSASDLSDALPKLRQEIIASFNRGPDAESKALQVAEARWLRLLTSLATLTPEQRRERLDQAKASAGSDPSTLNIAHALEEGAVQLTSNNELEDLLKIIEQQVFAAVVIPEFTR